MKRSFVFWTRILILGFVLTGGSSLFASTDTNPPIRSWSFIDGDGINGINKESAKDAFSPQLTIFNSKLYVIWEENKIGLGSSVVGQIRVAVYNGNDSAPAWSFVDGDGVNGINKNCWQNASAPKLVIANARLYATWQESNGFANQIRVAAYNGNDRQPAWSFVDGDGTNGINKDPARNASAAELAPLNSKLYAIWVEENDPTYQSRAEENYATYQIRAAVYDGNDKRPGWSFVDGNGKIGLNKECSQDAFCPQLTLGDQKLYATWYEHVFDQTADKDQAYQVRVAAYNGNDAHPNWWLVDGDGESGINKAGAIIRKVPRLAALNNKLYAAFNEYARTSKARAILYNEYNEPAQVKVAVYNGNDRQPAWSTVGGGSLRGINNASSKNAFNPQLASINSTLYAIWTESNGKKDQVRVAAYSGNDDRPGWGFLDGNGINGLNKDGLKNASAPQLAGINSRLYAVWVEPNQAANQIRVAVFK